MGQGWLGPKHEFFGSKLKISKSFMLFSKNDADEFFLDARTPCFCGFFLSPLSDCRMVQAGPQTQKNTINFDLPSQIFAVPVSVHLKETF